MSRREHTTALAVTAVLVATVGTALVAGSALAADHGGSHIELNGDNAWTVPRERVTVSGTSNREAGTTVFVELVRADGTAVLLAEAEVRDGAWNTTVDFSDVETGTYTLRATDGDAAASVRVEVVDVLPTPAETPFETPTPEPTTTSEPTATRTATPTRLEPTPSATPSTTTTTARTPGFDVAVGLSALALATAAARRRRSGP